MGFQMIIFLGMDLEEDLGCWKALHFRAFLCFIWFLTFWFGVFFFFSLFLIILSSSIPLFVFFF
jgi:hypothetical protein